MANEQKIIDNVKTSVNGLSESFKVLDEVLKKSKDGQKKLITNLREINKKLSGAKGLKEFVRLNKQLEEQQARLNKKQSEAIDLSVKNEKRKQSAIKTQELSIKAAKAEQIANEKLREAKKRTAAVEAKASKAEQLSNEQLTRSKLQTAKAEKRANAEKEKAQRQSREASRAYNIESKRLLALTKSAKDAAIQYGINSKQARKLRNEQQKLDRQIKKVDASLGQHQRSVGHYGKALGGLKNILGAAGIGGGIMMLTRLVGSSIRTFKNYQSANADLAAVLGKTRKETVKLQRESKRLGGETAFSASQVVELQTELARLGKTEGEIIQMTEGIIDATIALGSETGETAALVGSTLNAFQLEASESSKVADVLTLSTQRSSLSFEKLNTALPTVAGAARAAGYSLERTVSMLGQVSDRGIDASTAASSLRNIFIELSKSGVTLEDALADIQGAQDKLGRANQLFGKRAAVTALALADTTKETKELTAALIESGGTAEQVAAEKMNTLEGKLDQLGAAWEKLTLSVMEGQTTVGSFVSTTIEALTKLFNWLSEQAPQIDITGFIPEAQKKTDEELKSTRDVLQKRLQEINNVYSEQQMVAATGIKTWQERMAFMIDADSWDILPDGFSGNILKELEKIQEVGREYAETKQKLTVITKLLNGEELEENENKKELSETINDTEIAVTDLIKIQEQLLKQAREMPGSTEREIALRNRKVIAIEKEISRLKELGKIQEVEAFDMSDSMESYKSSFEEMEDIENEYLKGYLEREEKKTEIAKEQEEKRKELRKENEEALYELGTELGNALFERRIEQYNQDLEANSAYYDNLLANQELSEEQRALLEAQRLEKENEIRAKQRQAEKQQFLFNQLMAVGEIWIETAKNIAANPAFAPFYTSLGAIQTGIVLAQSIPAFAKGTDNAPGGASIVGEKGTELVMSKDKKTAWLTDNKPQLTNLNKGDKVIPHNQLLDSINNYTNSQIVNNSDKITGNDELIGKLVSRMIDENSKGNKGIIKAIERNNPKQSRQTTIDRMRTDDLKSKLRN